MRDNPALSSVRAKIDRASKHLENIKTIIESTIPPSEQPTTSDLWELKTEGKMELIVYARKPEPIDPSLPLIIGDCIHNLRSALDHLVFQLALRNGASGKSAEKTFFPICLTSEQFEQRISRDVKPNISVTALAEIVKCQPYSAYDVPDESDIWILHKLDIIDKHRLLVVVGHKAMPVDFTLTVPSGETFQHILPNPKWKLTEHRTELIRFDLSKAIKHPGKVHVDLHTVGAVQTVDTGMICDEVPIVAALEQCLLLVMAIVRDFGQMFFGE